MGFMVGLIRPTRLHKIAIALRPQTLLRFHHALIKLKYRLLYAPRRHVRPGPKGPSKEVIDAVVALKQRNPKMGCRKIAEHLALTSGIKINKDVVRRIFEKYYPPTSTQDGPSWITALGHSKDSLWSVVQAPSEN